MQKSALPTSASFAEPMLQTGTSSSSHHRKNDQKNPRGASMINAQIIASTPPVNLNISSPISKKNLSQNRTHFPKNPSHLVQNRLLPPNLLKATQPCMDYHDVDNPYTSETNETSETSETNETNETNTERDSSERVAPPKFGAISIIINRSHPYSHTTRLTKQQSYQFIPYNKPELKMPPQTNITEKRIPISIMPFTHIVGAGLAPALFPTPYLTPQKNLSQNRREYPQNLSPATHHPLILNKWDFPTSLSHTPKKSVAKSERISRKSVAWPPPKRRGYPLQATWSGATSMTLRRADEIEGAGGAEEAIRFSRKLVALKALNALLQVIIKALLFFDRQCNGEDLARAQIMEV